MRQWKNQTAVVIPCHNEALHIGQVAAACGAYSDLVLVVDDGSTDRTSRAAEEASARVLRHELAQGKGAALAAGLSHARQAGTMWAITLDGDGQHSPEDIPKFWAAAESEISLVIGNRMGTAGAMPPVRRFVNRWMSARMSNFLGVELPDTQCGFRLVNLEQWARFSFQTRHFEYESEMLARFVLAGCKTAFVPIQAIYREEKSKIRPCRDGWRWLCWWSAFTRNARRDSASFRTPGQTRVQTE